MVMSFGVALLAAGQGKRLKMDVAKPLAPALGKCLIDFSLEAASQFISTEGRCGEITVITGHRREDVEKYLSTQYLSKGKNLTTVMQEKQLGTADALRSYFRGNPAAEKYDYTLVLCADTPLIRSKELDRMMEHLLKHNADGVVATFSVLNPHGYGRIVRGRNSIGFHIVEEKDASIEIKKIQEVNSGLYILKTSFVLKYLNQIESNNQAKEFYLTDLFQDDRKVLPLLFPKPETFLGVNDLAQLEEVSGYLRQEKNESLRERGVRFVDIKTAYIDWDAEVAASSLIYPNVFLHGPCRLGERVVVGTGSVIHNSTINSDTEIKPYTVIEDALVRSHAQVGPFARIRPGTDIGEKSKIGNFVEMKKAKLEKGVKVSHLSYVGDAFIGEDTNVGCGFITCNYDGANKHVTKIGKNSFIGSDSQTVAPVTIGDNCFVASSSTITQDMPDNSFAISRNRQTTKEGMASRFLKKK